MNRVNRERRALLKGAGIVAMSLPLASVAQQIDVRIINGAPPGGALDALCRQVAGHIQRVHGRTATVENRTGAAGQIATTYVKQSPADGATVLCTPMSQFGIFPHTYKKLAYEPLVDFAAVSMGATFDLAVAVGPAVPLEVITMRDFLAWSKANPKHANYGSPGAGSSPHFLGALLGRAGNVELSHVAYRGSPPAVADLVAGQIESVISSVGEFLPFLESKKCRIIATAGAKRSRFAPAVPTLIEQGFVGMEYSEWFGFFVPTKTPLAKLTQLNSEIRSALEQDDVIRNLAAKGVEARASTPQELLDNLQADTKRWEPIVKSIGFTADS